MTDRSTAPTHVPLPKCNRKHPEAMSDQKVTQTADASSTHVLRRSRRTLADIQLHT